MSRPYLILLAHGSRSASTRTAFLHLTDAVASRLPHLEVRPAFLQFSEPLLADQIAAIARDDAAEIRVMPYFLHAGRHVTHDIPAAIEAARAAYPACTFSLLDPLENEPWVEDAIVQRAGHHLADALPQQGAAIEAESHAIIDRRLAHAGISGETLPVVRRVIHATADFSFAESLRIHPEAIRRGRAALARGAPILCDSTILQSGITRTSSETICVIREDSVRERARAEGTTRAVAAMRTLASRMENAIIAIGNAPTALWEVMALAERGEIHPALIVGLPVGFVGALESKTALSQTDLPFITNLSPRGGSPAAAAALNALALMDHA